jgi:hypothetical protein
MGRRGPDAYVPDPEFRFKSPIEGLNRDQYNFLMGKFRWTEPKSPWGTELRTRAAWRKYREALLDHCSAGLRPLAFWYFEKKLREGELPWSRSLDNAQLILKHRCWRDEGEREYCKQTVMLMTRRV